MYLACRSFSTKEHVQVTYWVMFILNSWHCESTRKRRKLESTSMVQPCLVIQEFLFQRLIERIGERVEAKEKGEICESSCLHFSALTCVPATFINTCINVYSETYPLLAAIEGAAVKVPTFSHFFMLLNDFVRPRRFMSASFCVLISFST